MFEKTAYGLPYEAKQSLGMIKMAIVENVIFQSRIYQPVLAINE